MASDVIGVVGLGEPGTRYNIPRLPAEINILPMHGTVKSPSVFA